MKIKRYRYNSRVFYSIVDTFDCPVDPYLCAYINTSLIQKSLNTTKRYVNELLYVVQYFNNMPDRVASGEFISFSEFSTFFNFCCYKVNATKDKSLFILPSTEDKNLRNIMVANQNLNIRVKPDTIQGRIRALRKFIEWLFNKFHFGSSNENGITDKYESLIARIILFESDLSNNQPVEVQSIDTSIIPDDKFIELLEIILPSSPNNPFKGSKIRNYLIVSVLIMAGIRRGALAKLKISDCQFQGSYDEIFIYRSGIDPTEKRLDVPNQKTKSHLSVLSTELLQHVKFYIDYIRIIYPKSITHDFVFISEKDSKRTEGLPLSINSINEIFKKLSKALGIRVTAHMLRYKWNENFDEAAEKEGIDSKRKEDIRKYEMGWVEKSKMNQKYNEKSLHKHARKIHIAHQERINKQR